MMYEYSSSKWFFLSYHQRRFHEPFFIKIIILCQAITLYNLQIINPTHPHRSALASVGWPRHGPVRLSGLSVSTAWVWVCPPATVSNDFHLKPIFVLRPQLNLLSSLFILFLLRTNGELVCRACRWPPGREFKHAWEKIPGASNSCLIAKSVHFPETVNVCPECF